MASPIPVFTERTPIPLSFQNGFILYRGSIVVVLQCVISLHVRRVAVGRAVGTTFSGEGVSRSSTQPLSIFFVGSHRLRKYQLLCLFHTH
jgi:hypothetical protein